MSIPQPANEREYARIEVDLAVRFRILDTAEAAELQETLEAKPTVWAPSHEKVLLDLALLSGDEECPPIRMITRIVHRNSNPPSHYGFKFEVINTQDHDRLIRYISRSSGAPCVKTWTTSLSSHNKIVI